MTSYRIQARRLFCSITCALTLACWAFIGCSTDSAPEKAAAPEEPETSTVTTALHATDPAWLGPVGASPFDGSTAVDIADYCDGTETDSTACIAAWIAGAAGRHLYVSEGTYTISAPIPLPDGMHLRCLDPDRVTFVKSTSIGKFFEIPSSPRTDVSIENCGFDHNGESNNFGGVVNIDQITDFTFRGNRVFDGTGFRCKADDCKRRDLNLRQAEGLLIEDNYFVDGSGLTVGWPGRKILIRRNVLNYASRQGIQVASAPGSAWPDGSNVIEQVVIEDNVITDAGIHVGAELEDLGAGLTTREVVIAGNTITGDVGSCILAMLSETSGDILIDGNQCFQAVSRAGSRFNRGIAVRKANGPQGPFGLITVRGNNVWALDGRTLDNGGIMLSGLQACLLDNQVSRCNAAAKIRAGATAYLHGNDWGGGNLAVYSGSGPAGGATTVDLTTADLGSCYMGTTPWH